MDCKFLVSNKYWVEEVNRFWCFGNFIVYGINWLKIIIMIFYRFVVCIVFVFKFYDVLCLYLCIYFCLIKNVKINNYFLDVCF